MKNSKMMKRIVTMIVVLCLALTALTAGAFADNSSKTNPAAVCEKGGLTIHKLTTAEIYIDNDSDADIMGFNMALATDTSWGDDLLGKYFVSAGNSGDIDAHVTYSPTTEFQVRFILRGGETVESDVFNLDGITNPEAVTFVLHGTEGAYHIGVR